VIRTLFLAVAAALLIGWFGPTLDDHSDERAQAQNLEDAQKAAQSRRRFEQAAQHACGPQAAWAMVTHDTVQCHTKRGRKTIVAHIPRE